MRRSSFAIAGVSKVYRRIEMFNAHRGGFCETAFHHAAASMQEHALEMQEREGLRRADGELSRAAWNN